MKTSLSFTAPAELETECLCVAVVDEGDGDKNSPKLLAADDKLRAAAAELISAGEVTGKIFETVMLHGPKGLRAKRLLLIGGGKARNFSSYELRKVAGTAVRFFKPKSIKSLAFAVPANWGGAAGGKGLPDRGKSE